MRLLVNNIEGKISECRDGVVVIALASHLRGPNPGHEWVKLVVGSLLCSERFFSESFGFPLSSKINIATNAVRRRSPDPTPVRSLSIVMLAGVGWVS